MAEGKIRVIIKRPDEKYGHVTYISPSLKNLQTQVGGHIETVTIGDGIIMICNEEGKILGLERNFYMGFLPFLEVIVGTVIICGADGENFGDVPISLKEWKQMLKVWGN